ncbi:MAG: ATP-binding protein [Myxococcales bacterium]|jgi:two-component system sensor histidine kinase MtrB
MSDETTTAKNGLFGRLSLRGFVVLAAGISAVLALAAVITLVGYVSHFRQLNHGMSLAIERVRAAEHIQADLLRYHQLAGLSLLAGPEAKPARLRDTKSFERRLERNVELTHRGSLAEPEARALEKVERALVNYLAVYGQVEKTAEVSPLLALRALNEAYDVAFTATDRLIDLDLALSAEAHKQAQFGHAAAVTALTILGLLMATLAVVIRAERAYVFRPLLSLKKAMLEFAHGRLRPAPEAGTRDLREITRSFNEMATALARNREAQLRYLSGVAHDLRNPLTALKGAARLLAPGRSAPTEKRARELSALFSRQVERLDRMVGDLLDSTRIEAGRLELRRETTDLRALAAEAVELFGSSAERHRIELTAPERLPVLVDPLRVSQVLNNLLSNAIKYSPDGGMVRVAIERDACSARIRVSDPGMGIPAEELDTIFQPFRRSSTAPEGIPGVGLGLSVTRRIVEAHGGRITVESSEGKGSTFTVTFPIDAAQPEAHAVDFSKPCPDPC